MSDQAKKTDRARAEPGSKRGPGPGGDLRIAAGMVGRSHGDRRDHARHVGRDRVDTTEESEQRNRRILVICH